MATGRLELESLSRDELLRQARQLGVERPEFLTRPELVDEILRTTLDDEAERNAARGLLGRARDLVARVMEKGLHLPDAASKLRTLAPAIAPPRRTLRPIATVALAQVYAAQGHHEAALEVLQDILEHEPNHAQALQLRQELLNKQAPDPTAAHDEPAAEQESVQPAAPEPPAPRPLGPSAPSRDQLRIERRRDDLVRVSWSVRAASFAHRRAGLAGSRLVIRLMAAHPRWQGPEVLTQDLEIDALSGRMDVPVTPGAALCAALGVRLNEAFRVLVSATVK